MHLDSKSRTKIPKWLMPVLGYTLSAVSLIWVFHGFNLQQTLSDLESLDLRYVSIAVIFDLAVYLSHGWRWNILLRPVARPSFWRSVQAIYIGLYANEVLPLRTGEVIRCYLLAHWNGLYMSIVLASAAIERLMDGVWMVLAFVITANFLKLPAAIVDVVRLLSVVLFLLLAVLLFVIFHKHHAHAVVARRQIALAFPVAIAEFQEPARAVDAQPFDRVARPAAAVALACQAPLGRETRHRCAPRQRDAESRPRCGTGGIGS